MKIQLLTTFIKQPRYLRAIPSLMVLTTAIAWGVLPDGDDGDTVQEKARVTLVQPSGEVGLRGPAG